MEKIIGGTKRVKLTHDLLDLIILVHDYKKFHISLNQFEASHDQLVTSNWYNATMKFYNNLNDDCLKRHYLSKNIISFEKVLAYKVTGEMLDTESHLLPDKFSF